MKLLWILTLTLSSLTFAQTITNIQALPDILSVRGQEIGFPLLSPDGSMISFDNGIALCIHHLETSDTGCYDYPEKFGSLGNYSTLVWSPDNTQIIFTESFFDRFVDCDLWRFELSSTSFSNLTDDGVDNLDLFTDTPDPALRIDYMPYFSTNGELYFLRSQLQGHSDQSLTDRLSLELSKYSPNAIETLKILYPKLSLFSIYKTFSMSPDGKKVAFIVLHPDFNENTKDSGIYILDLETNWLTQVFSLDDSQPFLPEDTRMFPEQLSWVDNKALVIRLLNTDNSRFPNLEGHALYLDLQSKQLIPLEDFTDFSLTKALEEPKDDNDLYNRIPKTGLVLPTANAYLYAALDFKKENLFIWSQPLPFTESAQLLRKIELPDLGYGETETHFFPGMMQTLPSISQDGKRVLIFGYLLTLE